MKPSTVGLGYPSSRQFCTPDCTASSCCCQLRLRISSRMLSTPLLYISVTFVPHFCYLWPHFCCQKCTSLLQFMFPTSKQPWVPASRAWHPCMWHMETLTFPFIPNGTSHHWISKIFPWQGKEKQICKEGQKKVVWRKEGRKKCWRSAKRAQPWVRAGDAWHRGTSQSGSGLSRAPAALGQPAVTQGSRSLTSLYSQQSPPEQGLFIYFGNKRLSCTN